MTTACPPPIRSRALLLLLLFATACQSKSSEVLAQKDFGGVTYQIIENIDANVKLTHREWVLRRGQEELVVIKGHNLMGASIPERSDVPYVTVRQARGGSTRPSLLLLPKDKVPGDELPRLAELLSDPSAWLRNPDANDIVIGGLLSGDGSEYLLRYDSPQGDRAITVDVYGVVSLRKSDDAEVFVGRVAEGGRSVPVESAVMSALEQAEPGGLVAFSDYKTKEGELFGSRFAAIPAASPSPVP